MADALLIIPAYNEENNIEKVLYDVLSLNMDIDMLVVNDGSLDGTKNIVEKYNVHVISHLFNLGYGAALQTGFKYACRKKYEYVIQFDADGQHDPADIPLVLDELKKKNADIIIGSRFLRKKNTKIGSLKVIVIILMRFLIKVFGKATITDPTSGFKGLSRRIYSFYSTMGNFPSDYPDADLSIYMLRAGYKLYEIPVNSRRRNSGKSMHSGFKPIVYLMKMLVSILAVVLRNNCVKEK